MQRRLTVPAAPGNRSATGEIAALFLRLDCTAVGGPAAHVALMEAEVVTKRGWLGRAVVGFACPLEAWQWLVVACASAVLLRTSLSATLLLLGAALAGIVAQVSHLLSS